MLVYCNFIHYLFTKLLIAMKLRNYMLGKNLIISYQDFYTESSSDEFVYILYKILDGSSVLLISLMLIVCNNVSNSY